MLELIAFIVLILSLFGLGFIILRKIPLLLELPETISSEPGFKLFFQKIRNLNPLKEFSGELFLQKILSKIRVLTLKTDSKTSNWLRRLREKSLRKKNGEKDDYWQEIKDSTGGKGDDAPR